MALRPSKCALVHGAFLQKIDGGANLRPKKLFERSRRTVTVVQQLRILHEQSRKIVAILRKPGAGHDEENNGPDQWNGNYSIDRPSPYTVAEEYPGITTHQSGAGGRRQSGQNIQRLLGLAPLRIMPRTEIPVSKTPHNPGSEARYHLNENYSKYYTVVESPVTEGVTNEGIDPLEHSLSAQFIGHQGPFRQMRRKHPITPSSGQFLDKPEGRVKCRVNHGRVRNVLGFVNDGKSRAQNAFVRLFGAVVRRIHRSVASMRTGRSGFCTPAVAFPPLLLMYAGEDQVIVERVRERKSNWASSNPVLLVRNEGSQSRTKEESGLRLGKSALRGHVGRRSGHQRRLLTLEAHHDEEDQDNVKQPRGFRRDDSGLILLEIFSEKDNTHHMADNVAHPEPTRQAISRCIGEDRRHNEEHLETEVVAQEVR
ncbi:hypothetical protein DFH06DRAFT_1311956 [Mycena polygramma]|nr:hypothetical protein DFH06DRAFT_1311956 [Mycena polygramma]